MPLAGKVFMVHVQGQIALNTNKHKMNNIFSL